MCPASRNVSLRFGFSRVGSSYAIGRNSLIASRASFSVYSGRPGVVRAEPLVAERGVLLLNVGAVPQHDRGDLRGGGGAVDLPVEPLLHQHRQPAAVVGVGVGEDDGVQVPRVAVQPAGCPRGPPCPPWNSPQSSRMRNDRCSSRCWDPVTSPAAPSGVYVSDMCGVGRAGDRAGRGRRGERDAAGWGTPARPAIVRLPRVGVGAAPFRPATGRTARSGRTRPFPPNAVAPPAVHTGGGPPMTRHDGRPPGPQPRRPEPGRPEPGRPEPGRH